MTIHPRRQRGLSLIELMVALVIGSVLVLGLIQVFGASRAAYQLSEGMSRVQENARFAMDFLQRDIRMAGHFGCVNDQAHWVRGEGDPALHVDVGSAPIGHPLNFALSVQGYEANDTAPADTVTVGAPEAGWTPGLPAAIATLRPAPIAGSDIIALRFLGRRGTPVTAITDSAGVETITFPAAGWEGLTEEGVAAPTLFGIADCAHANVFPGAGAAGAVTVGAASPPTDLVARYTPHPSGQTSLYRAESLVYYVGLNVNGLPALYRARADGAGEYGVEELVEGIESLQLLYGQDQTTQLSSSTPPVGSVAEQYTAEGILAGGGSDAAIENAWRRVGQVQVGILASSPLPAAAVQSAGGPLPSVLGVVFAPPETHDGRLRVGYETTVALRNRLFGN